MTGRIYVDWGGRRLTYEIERGRPVETLVRQPHMGDETWTALRADFIAKWGCVVETWDGRSL